MMPDMRGLRYITSPNMAVTDGKNHAPSIDNSLRGMLSMSPFSSRCCQHNHGMGWPYYTEHLVMATTDGGLATMLYAPSETSALVADGQQVRLTEDTRYPFEEDVTLTIHTTAPVEFPLYLRIPAWAEGATLMLNGEQVSPASSSKYLCITREWQDGDIVTLHLPMQLRSRVWPENKSSVSFDYGPLTLSLHIGEEYRQRDSRDHEIVQDDSHWQDGVDASLWPAYEIFATTPWNYAAVVDDQNRPQQFTVTRREWPADDYPFTLDAVPLTFTIAGQRVPAWGFDDTGMTDTLPSMFRPRDTEKETLQLVPMGAARLRIAAFPRVVETDVTTDCVED